MNNGLYQHRWVVGSGDIDVAPRGQVKLRIPQSQYGVQIVTTELDRTGHNRATRHNIGLAVLDVEAATGNIAAGFDRQVATAALHQCARCRARHKRVAGNTCRNILEMTTGDNAD